MNCIISWPMDKIDVKHVYTEVDFAIGSQFIRHALDDSDSNSRLAKKQVASAILPGVELRFSLSHQVSLICCQYNTCGFKSDVDVYLRQLWTELSEGTPAVRLPCEQNRYIHANRVRFPAGSPMGFRMWESCRTMPLVSGFPRGSPVSPPPLRSDAAPYSPRFAIIGSQDFDIKNCPSKICLILNIDLSKIDEPEIQNHEIALMQHFHIETKIKLDPGSELGSSDLGSGKMSVQPGVSRPATGGHGAT
ncbi:hypothetical protein PR048_029379 [Dryococelus australis]|uniref:Uncharacterized protein n=1 Tax=Dryococelus australis TaxID=614101 RepID=A0ABQ9GFT3_9NEOP|nr:hypothetical protein PR048_029379 [Dryococelus australis]